MSLVNFNKIKKTAARLPLSAIAPAGVSAASGLFQVGAGLTNRAENLEHDPDYLGAAIGGGVDLAQAAAHPSNPFRSKATGVTPPAAPSRVSKAVGTVGQKLAPLGKALAPAGKLLAPLGKAVGKYGLPGANLAFSGYSAYNNFKNKNYLAGALDLASGASSLIPVGGALISPAIDAANYGIQAYKNVRTPSVINNQNQQSIQGIQQFNQSGGQLDSSGKNINIIPPTTQVPSTQPQTKMSSHLFKKASQFKRDLENPDTGLNSDLYTAIAPMIGADGMSSGPDEDRSAKLKENVRKGLVGLEYLTGLKKNTGETFYDEHPAQAVATDIAGHAPAAGAAIAAGGIGKELLRQWRNFEKTQPASMAREGNRKVDATNSAQLLDPAGRARPDISRVFGDFESNTQKRLAVLDRLNKTTSGGFLDRYNKLTSGKAGAGSDKKLKELLTEARNSPASAALTGYADVHQSLQHAQSKGGLKGAMGEGLHSLKGKGAIGDFISKYIAPDAHSEIGDLFEKNKITGANPHFDEELIKDITREYRKGGDFSQATDPKGKAFVDTTLKNLHDRKLQSSGLLKALRKYKLPLIAGGATTAGLAGMYGLLKAIQNSAYSDEKRKDWKKTLLQSRGDFEEAKKLQ